MKKVTSIEKVSMYLIEYYFGFNNFITPMRLAGGPFFILLGFTLLYKFPIENIVYYAGFSFIFGFFVMLRPYFQILFRLENFKTEEIDLKVNKVGVFSKLTKLDKSLQHKDRIEIYRKLIADPKAVRKQRAAEGKKMKKGT